MSAEAAGGNVMNDSDQDFADPCSRLLKRVRKRPRAAERQPPSQAGDGGTKRRTKKDGVTINLKTGSVCTQPEAGDAGSTSSSQTAEPGDTEGLRAKDKVLRRMQQFKRASPQKMLLFQDRIEPEDPENFRAPLAPPAAEQGVPPTSTPVPDLAPETGDEALARRLQRELDREAAEAGPADLEAGGLFFCQICQRELSRMTPEGRTQHINRCLDEREHVPAPPPPPPPPAIPECPICGKRFKTQAGRSSHLKRCSSDMGVAPAVLIQALQRQAQEAQEAQGGATASTPALTGGTKRKGPSTQGLPARKKPKKKPEPLDEDAMVALALSSSLLEQEQRELRIQAAASVTSLKWLEAGRGRGRRKKGAVPRPPQLLLVQDPAVALARLQDRVSALLLRSRTPSPPTPSRSPSGLPGRSSAAPLWRKSALLDVPSGAADFYVPELGDFIAASGPVETEEATSACNKPSLPPVPEGNPVMKTQPSSSSSSRGVPPSPGAELLPGSGQALRDLMELAEDGMTLTQYGYNAPGLANDEKDELPQSGFVPTDVQPDTHVRGGRARQAADLPGSDDPPAAALSRLASDLGCMVNNPQLADLQLQVDSGDVFFAHSVLVYARCPLLAELVHESGFGVQEDGLPAARRALVPDVPGEAVLALLRYLYTAQFSASASLQPHVLELASRFDLQELQALAAPHMEEAPQEEQPYQRKDRAFLELLRSMWNEEDEEEEGAAARLGDGGAPEPDHGAAPGEGHEERVNEEELEEIYEFAATQRKREEEKMEEEEDDDEGVFTKLKTPDRKPDAVSVKSPGRSPGLDRSYNRLFSQSWGAYEESAAHLAPPDPDLDPDPDPDPAPGSPPYRPSGRTLLQSSASVIITLSPSPPPEGPALPVPGLSPGQGGPRESPLRAPSQSPPLLPSSRLPAPPPEQPELIVLSDSSDDTEVAGGPVRLNPASPGLGERRSLSVESSPGVPSRRASGQDHSPGDVSPEVSWLIPSTPVQPKKTCSGNPTHSGGSVRRTRLFPRGLASSPPISGLPSAFRPRLSSQESFLTPRHPRALPHSSTPLPTGALGPPGLPAASPLRGTPCPEGESSPRRSPDAVPSGAFDLSGPSEPSSEDEGRPASRGPGLDPYGGEERHEEGEESVDGGASSFQQSFMDEPPIAFNDSWGLDAHHSGTEEPAGFSLRLEDSGGSGQRGGGDRPPSERRGGTAASPPPESLSSRPVGGELVSYHDPPELSNSILDSRNWHSWKEEEEKEEEEEAPPPPQRPEPSTHLTPQAPPRSKSRRRRRLAPVTPMPQYSDMDTPELKNKLTRFGVRPLPKRQMILKLKEIHQYTHQLHSSDSEEEAAAAGGKPPHASSAFTEPRAPPAAVSPGKPSREEEPPSGSQESNTSSIGATEDSERSNPELGPSDDDGDSDADLPASQAASRLQDQLAAVRAFILSNPELYSQILHYQPLQLSDLQRSLREAGIRLGAAKLIDFLDSQCITFTSARRGKGASGRRGRGGGRQRRKEASRPAAKSSKKT